MTQTQVSQLNVKLNTFRKDIRKSQIYSIFTRQRNKHLNKIILEQTPQPPINYTHDVYAQQQTISKIQQLPPPQDPCLLLTHLYNKIVEARDQDNYSDFISSQRQRYPVEWFHPFLTRDVAHQFVNMGTKILGQYYFHTDRKIPSSQTLQLILDCFHSSEGEIFNNCLNILNNLLHDYKQIKADLVNHLNFVDLLVDKITLYRSQEGVLKQLLKVTYHLLNLSKQNPNYIKLVEPMVALILLDCNVPDINLHAAYNFHMLSRLFPASPQVHACILENRIIQRFVDWLQNPRYADRKFSYIIFDIIELCKEDFSIKDIKESIMPLIIGMRIFEFQYGCRSSVYTADKIKHRAYNFLLYLAEQHTEHAHWIFSYNRFKYLKEFLEELEGQTNPRTAQILAKIMYRISFYLRDQRKFIVQISQAIKRTIQINDYKYEIEKYFEGYEAQMDIQME